MKKPNLPKILIIQRSLTGIKMEHIERIKSTNFRTSFIKFNFSNKWQNQFYFINFTDLLGVDKNHKKSSRRLQIYFFIQLKFNN